LSRVGYYDKDR